MELERASMLLSAVLACTVACDKGGAPPPVTVGPAKSLDAEAGFIDVPPQASGSPYPARMFYVFEPADEDAAKKPLAIFTAGGPGYPTSLELLPYGTAHATLSSPTAAGAPPGSNPASWTSFANLLFVDERQSGFSYERGRASGSDETDAAACAYDPIGDAADFVRVILGFLDAHPAIRGGPVVLVGQSYGGERMTLALDLLLRYSTEAPRADATLLGTIQAHYDAVFPEDAGKVIAPSLAATQFGRVVLLQPFILGGLQYQTQAPLAASDPYIGNVPEGHDPYDVRQPTGWSVALDDTATIALGTLAGATTSLAVDPRSIPGMSPASRVDAFRIFADASDTAQERTNAAWAAALGPLGPADQYLVSPATACPIDAGLYGGIGSLDAFVANLEGGVGTFISDARYDSSIYAPAIPAALRTIATVSVDTAPRPGVARPGWFTVQFAEDGGVATPIEVRFPPYDDSGHFVALAEPQALHDDVAAWLGGP